MKKLFQYIAAASFAGLLMTACSPDSFDGADEAGKPTIEGTDFTLEVDQTTNTVTAKVAEKAGQYPLWYIPALTDAQSDIYSTLNTLQRTFVYAGDYEIKLRVANRNGVSDAEVTKTFHINNSLINFSSQEKALAGTEGKTWRINYAEPAHMGCGPSGTAGTEWWSAQPGDKADWGVYDDRLTFTPDGKYVYNPGEGGTVYVNTGSSVFAQYNTNDGNDFMAPVSTQEATWKFEAKGNDVMLTLPAQTLFPYISNDEQWQNPSFRVESIENTAMTLIYDNGNIAWRFMLTSLEDGQSATPAGFPGFDADADYNLFKTCNYQITTYYAHGGGWESYGDPSYTVNGNKISIQYPGETDQQWQNQFTFRTDMVAAADQQYDFSVVLESSTDIPSATVKICELDNDEAEKTLMLYNANISLKAGEPRVVSAGNLTGIDVNGVKIVFDFGGSPANTDMVIRDIVFKNHADGGGDAPLFYDDPANAWKAVDAKQAFNMSFWWADAGWSQIGDPGFAVAEKAYGGKVYTITASAATAAEWQAQNAFNTTGLAVAGTDLVDFSCVVTPSADSPRATIKLCQVDDDDNTLIYKNDIKLVKDEPQVLRFENVQLSKGADAAAVKLIFDLGGCPEDLEFSVTDITLIKKAQ